MPIYGTFAETEVSSKLFRDTFNDAASKYLPQAGRMVDHCSSLGFQSVSNIINDMSLYVQKQYPNANIYPGSY